MAITFNDTSENIHYLAALFGFENVTAKGWLRMEGQATPNPTNPLNIRASLEMMHQNASGFAVFETPLHGLYSARKIIERNAPAYGYDNIMEQAWSRDPLRQARVIERSSWAAGNYGSDWANDVPGNIWKYVKGQSVQHIDTTNLSVESGALITIPANVEILDGVGKVITKTTVEIPNLTAIGTNEDGWQSFIWTDNKIRFVRGPYPYTPFDPSADEVAVAIAELNRRIDTAQQG